jgi:hypothetical protein
MLELYFHSLFTWPDVQLDIGKMWTVSKENLSTTRWATWLHILPIQHYYQELWEYKAGRLRSM